MLTLASIGSVYERAIVDTGRQPEFLFFVAFLVTFGFIRTSAHMIRAQVKWWPGNVEVGGTHIHHLVWGICLLMIAGYVGVTIAPPSPWHEIVAVFFGIGMGLALDEFALWLDLKDVYWSEDGRKSIDAVIVAATITGLILVGFSAWVDVADKVEEIVFALVGTFGLIGIAATIVNLAKEKFGIAIVGFLIPPIGIVAAFRLGRPHSLWARLFYRDHKRKRAEARFSSGHHLPGRGHKAKAASGQSAAGSG
jgi:lysyl-tRNA synthetase class 2